MGSNGVQKLGLQIQFPQDPGLGMEHLDFSHITADKVALTPSSGSHSGHGSC